MAETPASHAARDLALSEAQEAVHVERYAHREGKFGGPDSFYGGMRYAEGIIRTMRDREPSGLAIEHRDTLDRVAAVLALPPREWDEDDADSAEARSARAHNHALAQVRELLAGDGRG